MKKRLSVIIPTIRPQFMERVLTGLLGQELEVGQELEIRVVENGHSTGETPQLVARSASESPANIHLSYVFRDAFGANAARNLGAEQTTGSLLAFLDDDCIPCPGWAKNVFRAHQRHCKVGCIGGQVDLEFLGNRPAWLNGPFLTFLAAVAPPSSTECIDLTHREKGHVVSANLSCRRDIYEATGGFRTLGEDKEDARSFTNDEVLFLDGARDLGSPGILLDSNIRVMHLIPPGRTTVESFEEKQYRLGIFDYRYWLHRRDFDDARPPFKSDELGLYNTVLLDTFLTVPKQIALARSEGLNGSALHTFTANYLRCRLAYLRGFNECLVHGEPLKKLYQV